jgi:hypothetical protein
MLIRSGDVALRGFEPALTEALYEIRNHPSVRQNLRTTGAISRESHAQWVHENLVAERRVHLFVVTSADAHVGIALLRNFSGTAAEVGLMTVDAPRRRLASYKAAHLIGYYGFEILGLESLLSYVPRTNRHALAFNTGCGFERTGADTGTYFELRLGRETSRSLEVHRRFRARYPIEVA